MQVCFVFLGARGRVVVRVDQALTFYPKRHSDVRFSSVNEPGLPPPCRCLNTADSVPEHEPERSHVEELLSAATSSGGT